MKKPLASYANLSRLAPASHFRAASNRIGLAAYTPANITAWAVNVGRYWFRKKHAFPTWAPPSNGIFTLPDQAKVAVAGDWATGTYEAAHVAAEIARKNPDYTIHLGDTYYVGSDDEIDENFLGVQHTQYDPTSWPRGNLGTFVLLGNHEMYTNGAAFFTKLLPAFGQEASYFCLQNGHWRIIGLDTGYNSTGVELGPIQPSCRIPDAVIAWLALEVGVTASDPRGVILMTHHGPWSAFDRAYPKPAEQLAQAFAAPVLWFWGHEHRLAAYSKFTAPTFVLPYKDAVAQRKLYQKGLTAHGRCVGNGGMPCQLRHPSLDTDKPRVLFYDARVYTSDISGCDPLGYNGFVELEFDGPTLSINYHDLNGNPLFFEGLTVESLRGS